jgi:hypothetical protein
MKQGISKRISSPGLAKIFAFTSLILLLAFQASWIAQRPEFCLKSLGNELILAAGTKTGLSCMEVGDAEQRHRPLPSDTDRCLLFVPANSYFQLLMSVLVGLPDAGRCDLDNDNCESPHESYDEQLRKFGNDWPPDGFTMIGKERLANFWSAIHEVNRNHIPGAICEFGVWRGGAMMLAAAMLEEEGQWQRELYLFDDLGTFRGYDTQDTYRFVPLDDVQKNFRSLNLDPREAYFIPKETHFVDGVLMETNNTSWVERKDPIAVLRVNGKCYDSYQNSLYAVYQNVQVGGILILDEVMNNTQVMQFWEHFKTDHGLVEELVRIDTHSAWFRKKKDVKIDASKRRPVPVCAHLDKELIRAVDYKSPPRGAQKRNSYDAMYWKELPTNIQDAMEALGYDQDMWDDTNELPDAYTKYWGDLTEEEKTAAKQIGFDEEYWDGG